MLYSNAFTRIKLKEKYGDEDVLAVLRSVADSIPDKFSLYDKSMELSIRHMLAKAHSIKRYDAEYNPAVLQLVSYVIVRNTDNSKLFVSERTAGDERLIGKYSFFGGHADPEDLCEDIMLAASSRELHEETICAKKINETMRHIGFVRDNASKTAEHLGFVYLAVADKIKVREKKKMNGIWMDYDTLIRHYNDFDSWGRYIIDWLFVHHEEGKLTP